MSRKFLPDLLATVAMARPFIDAVVAVFAACMAAFTLAAFRGEPLSTYLTIPLHQVAMLLIAFILPLALAQYGAYRSQRDIPPTLELLRLWSALILVVGLLVVLAAISKTTIHVSRLWSGIWLVYLFILLTAMRLLARSTLRRLRIWGYDAKTILLVGNGTLASRVVAQLVTDNADGYRVVGYLAESPSQLAEFGGLPYLGRAVEARQICVRQRLAIDQVWVAIDEANLDELRTSIEALSELPYELRVVPDGLISTLCEMPVSTAAGLLTVELSSSPTTAVDRVLKAMEDRVLGTAIAIFAIPVLLLIALLIRMDSAGPVLFRQKRHGWNGEEITIFKFRTMHLHDEVPGVVTQAKKEDARVTRVGRWLRRSSLDELPQLINVLTGSMSLVGPRPHATEHNELYVNIIRNYMHRHRVKPGITGWAQVNGYRGETDTPEKMQRRVEYDLYYIEHWSIGFDLVILVLTFVRGLTSPQAY
ncbi:undecaprenyl-phosphate glucose phosphotransferase [Stenotrophobium rhamnosiphilum]|uniref:Undecaprenyl-phosphate glucose phosphotransferase n=1 Tax=Stenotrophobium rhamnosiphilum TaxID=2029166 RepID=A0A2T5MK54_9GAMM|nr:undecaprenyl-phosphate glucose phosphotransferase [Stenotrophobium rhamnosiphilum]PTU32929.1 undecaprenyl-phosphate glucose phosphotransferase [Stenotrophobium rhamnosiphilum]